MNSFKNIAYQIFLLFLLSCNHNVQLNQMQNLDIPLSKDRLKTDIKFFTSINPPRNYYNLSSLNKSAEYILSQFKNLNKGNTAIQSYIVQGNEYKNIICSFGPENGDRIIVGAHYDVYGDQPGADDNASGVAGLLEIARLINEIKPVLKNRIDLVAYSLEEPPFFRTKNMGSYIHAKSLANFSKNVKIMISLEMIGFFSEEHNSQKFPIFFLKWFYPDKANFIAVIGKTGQKKVTNQVKKYMQKASNLGVYSFNGSVYLPGVDFSDHLNYWEYGYNAVMITDTSFYRNPNYHQKTDTFETLDFDKMAEVVKGVYWTVTNI